MNNIPEADRVFIAECALHYWATGSMKDVAEGIRERNLMPDQDLELLKKYQFLIVDCTECLLEPIVADLATIPQDDVEAYLNHVGDPGYQQFVT